MAHELASEIVDSHFGNQRLIRDRRRPQARATNWTSMGPRSQPGCVSAESCSARSPTERRRRCVSHGANPRKSSAASLLLPWGALRGAGVRPERVTTLATLSKDLGSNAVVAAKGGGVEDVSCTVQDSDSSPRMTT
ncbi:hypothetical protein MRX96_003262 [Rhipicephalus microplus]